MQNLELIKQCQWTHETAVSPDPPTRSVAVEHARAGHREPVHTIEHEPVVLASPAPRARRRSRNFAPDLYMPSKHSSGGQPLSTTHRSSSISAIYPFFL
jgi:hypothetical protein